MADSDSSQRTTPVAPMFVEIGARRADMSLRAPVLTRIGAWCFVWSPTLPSMAKEYYKGMV